MRSAAITGIGCVTGFGVGVKETWRALLAGESAAHELDEAERAANDQVTRLTTRAPSVAVLSKLATGLGFPPPPRTSLLALVAAREAWEMAQLSDKLAHERAGLMINRNFGQHAMVESYQTTLWDKGAGAVSGLQFVQTIANAVVGRLAITFQLRGASNLFFGAPALGAALDTLRAGRADVILAGGFDEISGIVYSLCDLHKLTPASQGANEESRPYDRARAGLIPGDGAAFFVLERPEHARARGAQPLGYLRGYSSVGDSRSLRDPATRERADVAECIRRALADADIESSDIAYISGAAAGLRQFDEVETEATSEVLPHRPPLSSVKGALGETWGAAGCLSIMSALLALGAGQAPPTANLREPEASCAANLVKDAPLSFSGCAALALSFDMTGQDSAFVLTTEP